MRLGPIPCGCDSRKEIMFDYGKIGLPEAAMLVIPLTIAIIAWRINK